MAIRMDPEGNGLSALLGMADLTGRRVLEIGSGDGRFTWQFADRAAQVVGIDPDGDQIALAVDQRPEDLRDRVELRHVGFEEFASATASASFDLVILSWALC